MMWWLVMNAHAQSLELPAPSPRAQVMQRVGVVDVTVTYSSPGKKGREIWGGVVPYDEMWRTGANSATTFVTSADLTVAGKPLPAGTYSLLTIPGKEHWTLILNQDPEAGTDAYDEKKDAVRVQLDPAKGPDRERMTFLFSDTTESGTRLDLEWDGLRLSVPITVDTAALVQGRIGEYLDDASTNLARAGRFRSEIGDLDGALAVLEDSIAVQETWYNTWLKADVLHKMERHKAAYQAAQRSMELGKAAGEDFFFKERVEKALAEWRKK